MGSDTATVTVADTAATPETAAHPVLAEARAAWEQSLVALEELSSAEGDRYGRLARAQRRYAAAHRAWQLAEQAEDTARGRVIDAQQRLFDAVTAHRDLVDGRGGPVHISVAIDDLRHQLMGGRPGQLEVGS